MTIAEVFLKEFDGEMETTRRLLERVPSDRFEWQPHPKSMSMRTKASILRRVFMNHLVHHRGQLSVYLRLNDVPLPPIYGPSADEAPG
jgi:uncharacterized damage-inducible protein DinB